MQKISFPHSLRFKITLAVLSALILILGISSGFQYERHRELLVSDVQTQVARTSGVIQAALQYAMLTRNLNDLSSIINHVGQQPGVTSLFLINADNEVRFSAQPADVGVTLSRRALICQMGIDAGYPQASSVTYTTAAGEPVLRYCQPIVNQPACSACHSAQQPVLGALVTDFSLTETNQQLNAELRDTLLAGLGVLIAIVLAINLLLTRFALGKLERFVPILHRFGQGDLSARLPFGDDDEIGQLSASFNQMADGLQMRDQENARLYRELQEKEIARTQLLHKVIETQEEERRRLSRELHDDFSQSLTALSVTLQTALQTVPAEMRSLRQLLEQLQTLTVDILGETSRWIQDLRPRLLDDLGLAPAIRVYAEARLETSGTSVEVETHGLEQRLPPEIEITLFRVAQEAISNIAKHARARHAHVRIDLYETGFVVERIEDDGIGFVPGKYLHPGDGLRGVGLSSMRERIALLGGTLTIDSTPGRGTLVRAEVLWKKNQS